MRKRRNEGTISPRNFAFANAEVEARMDRLLDEPDLHDESLRFAKHLHRYRDGLFLFLDRQKSMPRTIVPNRPSGPP